MVKNRSMRIDMILFLFAFFLIEFSTYATNIVHVNTWAKTVTNISIMVFLLDAVLVGFQLKFNYKKIILIFILIAASFFIYIKTDDGLILQLCLTIVCSLNKDFDKIVKSDLVFKVVTFIVIFIAYKTGNIRIDHFVRLGEVRNALGFKHPNTLGFFILTFYFELIYVCRNKFGMKVNLLLGLLAIALISVAHSRSSEIAIVSFLIVYILYYLISKIHNKKQNNSEKRVSGFVIRNSFVGFIGISYYITHIYTKGAKWILELNELLSYRISIQNAFIQIYNTPTLIGNSVNYFTTLDNAYIRCVISLGIIGTLIYMYVYNRTFYYSRKNNDSLLTIILSVLLIYGLMEWYIIRPTLNIFLIYAATYFLKSQSKEKIDE